MSMGEVIRGLRFKKGLSQGGVAQAVGVSRSAVSHWERGKWKPRRDELGLLAEFFGVPVQTFFDESDSHDSTSDDQRTIQMPLNDVTPLGTDALYAIAPATVSLVTLGSVHAGEFTDAGAIGKTIEVSASLLEHHPNAQAVLVEGDCMDKVFPPGSIAFFDPDLEPTNGRVVIVETSDHQVLIRRWFKGSKTLLLAADSHASYDDIVIQGDEPIRVIGTVFSAIIPEDML